MTMPSKNIDLILTEIETLKANQEYQKAKIVARSALVKYTDDYRLYEELADISLFEENLDEAETMIEAAEKLHPESGTGIYLRGYIAVARGDHKTAIETLTKANTLFPNNPEILRNLGWAFVLSGSTKEGNILIDNTPKGIALLRRASHIAPEDALITNDLAIALIASWEHQEWEKLLATIDGDLSRVQGLTSWENL